MIITSATNLRIKKIVKLKTSKARREVGLTVVDGLREVSRAKDAGIDFEELYICPEVLQNFGGQAVIDTVSSWNIPVTEVNEKVLEKISFGDRKEGIVAVVRNQKLSLSGLKVSDNSFFVVLDSIEKPGNLGAILRTCDGAGVDALLLGDRNTDIFNPNVIRASVGALFSVPVVQTTDNNILNFLHEKNAKILAATPKGNQSYFTTKLNGPLAIVLGREDKGLSDFWLNAADIKVSIPMRGKADSLNVSATAAVLIYEALRQRR